MPNTPGSMRSHLAALTASLGLLALLAAGACTEDVAVGRTEEGKIDGSGPDLALDGGADGAGTADTGAEDATPTDDGGTDDVSPVEVAGDASGTCQAGQACPCTSDAQCATGKCLIDPATGIGTCALPCQQGACPDGFTCEPVVENGIPVGQVCVPKPNCTPTAEVCNGKDDNCDGKTDEGFCFDGNPCTDDVCDAAGACGHPNNTLPCDDGNACSAGDACKDGQCSPGGKSACDDGSSCTLDTCDAKNGTCVNQKLQGGCEDGNACTLGDQCADGVCTPGKALLCDDANPCSDDSCDPKVGCLNLGNTAACDDKDPCTVSDNCQKGVCKGGGPKACDDKLDCTLDTCKAGDCVNLPIAASCSDGNDCTEADLCKNGSCAGSAKDCSDKSPCTIDSCEAGKCQYKLVPDNTICDDGNPCTANEVCDHDGSCSGVDKNCDDNNPCTFDKCQVTDGQCQHEPTQGAPCTDGNACTLGDACQNGACQPGGKKQCGDGNPCTLDACDASNAACVFSATDGACTDNNPCTVGDLCAKGQCVQGKLTDCADGNPCTIENCDTATGKCAVKSSVEGIACDDGQACTGGESCKDGACLPGKPLVCDDGNPCTKDSCDATGKCVHVNDDGIACEDGNPCTGGDACTAGACKSGKSSCECEKTSDCASKEDGNACNGTLFCEQVSHKCQIDLKTVVICDATKNTECLSWACNAKIGKCEPANAPTGKPCEADGSACTKGDACLAGICEPGPAVGCDDNNPCTNDLCDLTGGCSYVNNQKPCTDSNPCSEIDICSKGSCFGGGPKWCDDGNPCTQDSCDKGSGLCVFTGTSGGGCDDNNACTTGDVCNAGVCQAKSKVVCDDGKPCTADFCNEKNGVCSAPASPNGLACTDNNACTVGDACKNAVCVAGKYTVCNDNNPCTLDGCDLQSGQCTAFVGNNGAACNDGDECTVGDSCSAGMCKSGAAKVCSDTNPCILPSCEKATGKCVAKNGTAPCDDGNACSENDACTNGICTPAKFIVCNDGEPCTNDACDTKTGKCAYVAVTKPCTDNNKCTAGDTCAGGTCTGKPISCNDGSPCTADACDPATGCTHAPTNNGLACSDGNACTSGDACLNGACKGTGIGCNDGNPCTVDTCDPKSGCKYTATNGACNDGNPCTVGDSCATGKCVSGTAALCTDSNDCTDDQCNPANGECTFTADDTNTCSDNNACSTGDACKAGKCQLGAGTKNCDDANPCTAEWCDPSVGCKVTPNQSLPCDDGNACTLKDVCTNGKCASGTLDLCNDGSVCTADTCDKLKGCAHSNVDVPCDDGNACQGPDACSNGKCTGQGAVLCDDANVCTTDTCDPKVGCIFAPVQGGGSTTDVFVSSNGTQASDTAAPGGGAFPTFINFKAAVPTFQGGNWTSAIQGATWVWTSFKVANPTQDVTAEFRQSFPINDPAKVTATLQVAADNTLVCWVNDKMVLNASGTDNFLQPKVVEIKAALLIGNNLLRCQVTNAGFADATPEGNPAGLAYRLDIKTLVNGAPCDDGNECTTVDVCFNGSCTGVVGQTCDDGNPCTADKCSNGKGCTNTVVDGTACEDGDPCSSGDKCAGGKCTKGNGVSCDDGQACTVDLCDPKLGCNHKSTSSGQFTAIAVPSDSKTVIAGSGGNAPATATWDQHPDWTHAIAGATWLWSATQVLDPAKTTTVTLQRTFDVPAGIENVVGQATIAVDGAFVCKLNSKVIGVETAEENYKTPIKLSLNGKLVAGPNVFACTVTNPGKPGSTAQSNPAGLLFRLDLQWYAKGGAVPCDDGNGCTVGDWCKGFFCQSGSVVDCDDNDACTSDYCDPKVGCGHKDSGATACDDGNACTVSDVCAAGKCTGGKPASCDDYDPCTTDSCDAKAGCAYAQADGASCTDNNPCTVGDACKAGKCVATAANLCNDNNACTVDACSTSQGCYYNPTPGACDDANSCTINDQCSGGQCLGVAQNGCSDNNACTNDVCDPTKGCISTPVALGPCDDGNPCTLGDGCKAGVCSSGTTKPCTDGNPCTIDSCDTKGAGGCLFNPQPDGQQCEDGNPCTVSDICAKAKCVMGKLRECGDGNPCTDDACDPDTGNCVNKVLVGIYACDDGDACSLGDQCKSGACVGSAKACNDNIACTADSCNSGTGQCVFKAIPGCQP